MEVCYRLTALVTAAGSNQAKSIECADYTAGTRSPELNSKMAL